MSRSEGIDFEVKAIQAILDLLEQLDDREARLRVLTYLSARVEDTTEVVAMG